jgi:hypothetical protein
MLVMPGYKANAGNTNTLAAVGVPAHSVIKESATLAVGGEANSSMKI